MSYTYYGLLTLDLNLATSDERNKFNEKMENMNFQKIKELTTTWKFYFENETKANAISIVEKCLETAKIYSGVSSINYAIQMGTEEITLK